MAQLLTCQIALHLHVVKLNTFFGVSWDLIRHLMLIDAKLDNPRAYALLLMHTLPMSPLSVIDNKLTGNLFHSHMKQTPFLYSGKDYNTECTKCTVGGRTQKR